MIAHILIIDADTAAAQVTRSLVTRVCPEALVLIAPSSARAAPIVQAQLPQILIIDPGRDQLADERFIRAFKATNPGALIIALTATPPARLLRQLRALGVDTLLEKSATPAALLRDLQSALAGYGGAPRLHAWHL